MRVNVITPINKGGPYYWGKNLVRVINEYGDGIHACHTHQLKKILTAPLYQNFDIVHAEVPLTYKLWNKPTILTLQGEYTIEKNIWRHFYPLAVKKADVVTSSSNFLKDRLGVDKAIVIPNGIFTDRYKIVAHQDKDTVNLVTLTKFAFKDKSEGVLDLIRIVEKASKNSYKDINYTIIGGGKYLDHVKEKIKNYNVNVNFTGFISDPGKILEGNDIFIYYSAHDNFPTAILEGMASGLPVITNNVGAVNEIITNRKDGYIALNSDEYLDYLIKLIDDHNLRGQVGYNARKKVEDKFDWRKIVNSYVSLYKALLS